MSTQRKEPAPVPEAGSDNQRNIHSSTHENHMRQLAARIEWLERHRHWWLRQIRGAA